MDTPARDAAPLPAPPETTNADADAPGSVGAPAAPPTLSTAGQGRTRAEIAETSRQVHESRRALASELAAQHGGVLTRQMLLDAGMTRGEIRVEVERGAFVRVGRHTLSVVGAEPSGRALWWRAVWESGRRAVLDGTTALTASGLQGWRDDAIHVTVPYNATVRPIDGVRHHFLRDPGPCITSGLRRVKPPTAVVRAAQWAVSDRAAATIIAMTVQQRLVHPDDLRSTWAAVRYTPRRELLDAVIRDVCDGAQSLAELDFAKLCRERGLPEPSRQAVRLGERGRVYLDVYWPDLGVHVEVQGIQHLESDAVINDALRFNALRLRDKDLTSLQIPVLGLRLQPDRFMAQVEAALSDAARRRVA